MKEYLAPRLVSITREFINAQAAFLGRKDDDPEDHPELLEDRKLLKPWTTRISNEAKFLGLPSTTRQAIRIAQECDAWKAHEIDAAIVELERRFDEEIEALTLFYIPNDRIDFYRRTDLFGERFKQHFPQANSEICEAGKCFAFDRFTASVFHLTHAMEIALRVLFNSLGMTARIYSVTRWTKLLERIDGKIKKNSERLANHPDWKDAAPFYQKAHAFLAAACNPLRNSMVHVDVTYADEDSTRPVWLAVEAFMRHIATRLKES